ncbi:MAG: glycosyltransferase [Candidatus Berkelbacteria bacterium]|nr:glycosyltransferase [Candidatus Berkelbacteria bacterium]
MRVAIVHDYLTKLGGAEKVLQVIHKLYPEAPIYTLLYDEAGTKKQFAKNYDIRPSRLQKLPGFIRKRSRLLLSKFPNAIENLDLSEFDIVISSSNSFAHGVITNQKQLHITYCYSPARYLWDWSSQYLKENNIRFSPIGFYVRSLLSKLRIWDYYASRRTNEWVAISKTVAKRIKKYYRRDASVIYPPTNISELLTNDRKPGNYYLIVSRLTQYKNIDLAINVFNDLKLPLYIIGEGADEKRLKKMAGKTIKFLGWQSDSDRNNYIYGCRAFLFPGEDDFGLTPVEAMAVGRPVIAYRAGGATETVVERFTGEFFDDFSTTKPLKNTIIKFEKEYTKYNVTDCKEQAQKFSEEIFIKNFRDFIEEKYRKFKNEN